MSESDPVPPAKRMKTDQDHPSDTSTDLNWGKHFQQIIEAIDACQNKIDVYNEKASEDIVDAEQNYNRLRRPLFERRSRIIQKIPNFWLITFVNHPLITKLLDEEEEDCLHNLTKLDVEEFDDIKVGYRINFHFSKNEYFDNDVLTKEFFTGTQTPTSKSTPIQWKEGKNIIKMFQERNETKDRKQGKKRKSETRSFFTWFEENCNPFADEIAEVIRDDIWPNPLQYYLSPDIEVLDNQGEEGRKLEHDGKEEDDMSDSSSNPSDLVIDEDEDEDKDFENAPQTVTEPPKSTVQEDEPSPLVTQNEPSASVTETHPSNQEETTAFTSVDSLPK